MNPPNDAGKKPLPPGLLSRFTTVYVPELLDPEDLIEVVRGYLGEHAGQAPVNDIVSFYLEARGLSQGKIDASGKATIITDGSGTKPHYCLRTLARALRYARQQMR